MCQQYYTVTKCVPNRDEMCKDEDMTNTATATNTVLGTTDSYNGCDCCGRENLKVYVVISHEDGSIGHYGTACAGIMIKVDTRDITKAAKAADIAKAKAKAAAATAKTDLWVGWLAANGEGNSTMAQIKSLGGFAAATAAYEAA